MSKKIIIWATAILLLFVSSMFWQYKETVKINCENYTLYYEFSFLGIPLVVNTSSAPSVGDSGFAVECDDKDAGANSGIYKYGIPFSYFTRSGIVSPYYVIDAGKLNSSFSILGTLGNIIIITIILIAINRMALKFYKKP